MSPQTKLGSLDETKGENGNWVVASRVCLSKERENFKGRAVNTMPTTEKPSCERTKVRPGCRRRRFRERGSRIVVDGGENGGVRRGGRRMAPEPGTVNTFNQGFFPIRRPWG